LKKFEPPKAPWWRLLILDNQGSHTCITLGAPLRLFYRVEPKPRMHLRRKPRPSECKVVAFHPETLELAPAVRLLRKVAKSYNRPITELEDIYDQFRKNGMSEDGEIGRKAFESVLTALHGLQDLKEMPASRFEFFWREMDKDGNGKISFEEFLIWFCTSFQHEDGVTPEGLQTRPYRLTRGGGQRRASMLEMAARAKEAIIVGMAMEASGLGRRSRTRRSRTLETSPSSKRSFVGPKRSMTYREESAPRGPAEVDGSESSSSSSSATEAEPRPPPDRRHIPLPRKLSLAVPERASGESPMP